MTRAQECGDKVQYRNEDEALAAIEHGRRTRGLFRAQAYRCRYCGHWHIGHRARPHRRR